MAVKLRKKTIAFLQNRLGFEAALKRCLSPNAVMFESNKSLI
ncbi:hypothetical protein LDG_9066 [Legionella drancourtii LLAP12]|uniref:Uncharacterized protein n=1 Tax=Legionella drancourtii LLAP12 TaxID=658187 RepID=G9EUR6_9GAMM|nr:hypothetical protein LDG_9066 [Legionella drancourtii LLAP12]